LAVKGSDRKACICRPRIKGRFVKSVDSKPESGMEVDGTTAEGPSSIAMVKGEEVAHNMLGEAVGEPKILGSTQTLTQAQPSATSEWPQSQGLPYPQITDRKLS